MNILLIEDDEDKRKQISSLLSDIALESSLWEAKSLHSGLSHLISRHFDLIVADMSMPTFDIGIEEDGGRPQAYGGREILKQMNRRKIATPVLVVTQFDRFDDGADTLTLKQLDDQLATAYPAFYLGAVYYDSRSEDWKTQLANLIKAVLPDLKDI